MFVQYLWVLAALFVVTLFSVATLSLSRRIQRLTGPVLTAAALLLGAAGCYLLVQMAKKLIFRFGMESPADDALEIWLFGSLNAGVIVLVIYLMILPLAIALFGSTAASCGSIVAGRWRKGSLHHRLLQWSLDNCESLTRVHGCRSPRRSICAESWAAHWVVTGPALALLFLCVIAFLANLLWFFLSVCLPSVIATWRVGVTILGVVAAIIGVICGLSLFVGWLLELPWLQRAYRVFCPLISDDD